MPASYAPLIAEFATERKARFGLPVPTTKSAPLAPDPSQKRGDFRVLAGNGRLQRLVLRMPHSPP